MSKPRYLQIADTLIEKISNGELSAGSILPTEGELQKEFDVSRVTIRKAMQLLVDKDLLFRQRAAVLMLKHLRRNIMLCT